MATNATAAARLLVALLASAGCAARAQVPEPAAVGRDRPLTATWLCENERSVLINAHPRRRMEEAWLTYAGTRVPVERRRGERAMVYESPDGKVRWQEDGDEATLVFEGLLDRSVRCRRQDPPPR